MGLQSTPRFKLPFLFPGQAAKEATVNGSLVLVDGLASAATPKWGQSTPPATPADGDLYVIPPNAGGGWTGKDNQVAYYAEGWIYRNPIKGLRVIALDSLQEYVCADGASWQPRSSGSGAGALQVKQSDSSGAIPTILSFDGTAFGVSFNQGIATVTFKGAAGTASGVTVERNGATVGTGTALALLDFSTAFKVAQANDKPGHYTIDLAAAAAGGGSVAVQSGGTSAGTTALSTLNMSTDFVITAGTGTAAGTYTIALKTTSVGAILMRQAGKGVAITGDTSGADNAIATMDFSSAFKLTQTTKGYYALDLVAAGGSTVKLRQAGKAVVTADDPILDLDFSADFTLAETSPGYYTIAMAKAGGAAIKMRQAGATVATADDPVADLDFSSNFTLSETTAGYYAIDLAAGVKTPVFLAQGGKDITTLADGKTAVKPLSKLNFSNAFKLTPTDGGYWSIDLSASAASGTGGAALTVMDHGTAEPSAATQIDFEGSGVTVTPGTGPDAGKFTVTIQGASAGAENLNTYSAPPATIQVDAYDNQVVTLTADWSPAVAAGANAGHKIKTTLYLAQDSAGGHNVVWPTNVRWDGGQVPILSVGGGKIDIVYLESIDNGQTFIGAQIGGNI